MLRYYVRRASLIAALAISAAFAQPNLTNFYAVVTKVDIKADRPGFDVLTNPNSDPQSAYKTENKTIEVDANTKFEASAREDLKPGRIVQVVGVELRNGQILATKVTVYEGNTPVRMRKDAVIRRADGSVR